MAITIAAVIAKANRIAQAGVEDVSLFHGEALPAHDELVQDIVGGVRLGERGAVVVPTAIQSVLVRNRYVGPRRVVILRHHLRARKGIDAGVAYSSRLIAG